MLVGTWLCRSQDEDFGRTPRGMMEKAGEVSIASHVSSKAGGTYFLRGRASMLRTSVEAVCQRVVDAKIIATLELCVRRSSSLSCAAFGIINQ